MATADRRATMAGPREAGRERRTGEKGGVGPARLVGPSHNERKGEGRRAGGPQARPRARLAGPSEGKEKETARVAGFCFSFSKM
jgi:hypothetical protein